MSAREIRASAAARDRLRQLFPPAAQVPTDVALFGIPVVIDPLLPPGFAAIVGPPKPFDPADPLADRMNVVFIDLRDR